MYVVYIWKWSSAHALGGEWCGIIHYYWWTASIKPRLLFSRAGYASWGLSLSSVWYEKSGKSHTMLNDFKLVPTVYIKKQRKLDLRIAKSFCHFMTFADFFIILQLKLNNKLFYAHLIFAEERLFAPGVLVSPCFFFKWYEDRNTTFCSWNGSTLNIKYKWTMWLK